MIIIEEFDSSQKKKKPFSIEKSMAGGIEELIYTLTNNSKKLSKADIRAMSLLINEPFFKEDVLNELKLIPHEKGWITKQMKEFWKPFTRAFQSIWYNKRVQKALNKSGFSRDNW